MSDAVTSVRRMSWRRIESLTFWIYDFAYQRGRKLAPKAAVEPLEFTPELRRAMDESVADKPAWRRDS